MSIHYSLKPEVDPDTFLGGVLAVGDSSIDVKELLDKGDGVIEIADDEHVKASVLDDYPALQRVPAPEAEADDEVKTAPAIDAPRGEGVSAPADGVMREVGVSQSSTAPARSASTTDKKES